MQKKTDTSLTPIRFISVILAVTEVQNRGQLKTSMSYRHLKMRPIYCFNRQLKPSAGVLSNTVFVCKYLLLL